MKFGKSIIPLGTMVETFLPADYLDTYMCKLNKEEKLSPEDIMLALWTDFPKWVTLLFAIRNFLVTLLGLKKSGKATFTNVEDCIRKGIPFDFLSLAAKNKDEVVLLMVDKHLDAYLSLFIQQNQGYNEIYSITVVHFHNQVGRVYFWLIRPFHHLIMKNMMKRCLRKFKS